MRNWKTTAAGIAAAVGAVGTALAALLDGDPATAPNWTVVGGLVAAAVGLVAAADAPSPPPPPLPPAPQAPGKAL
jgi:hypothetical protein